ncbi:MAG: tetratricopeptide repeat protein [Cytophagaceae bacterium]|nr:tetratricopeptide repeat protein [Cytophagaceae bacterium]
MKRLCTFARLSMRMNFIRRISILTPIFFLLSFFAMAQNTLSYEPADAHFRTGLEFIGQRNYAAARQEFQQYLDTHRDLLATDDFDAVTAEYYVAMTALYLGYPEAELQADRFAINHAEHPKAGQLYADLGLYFYNQQQYDRALPYLEKAAGSAGYGNQAEARFKLGMAYYNLQQWDKALRAFSGIKQQSDPATGVPASYYAAVIAFNQGDYASSVTDFRRVENTTQYKNEIPGWIGHALYRQRQHDQLLAYAEPLLRATRSGKKLDELALLTADVYFQREQYEKAVANYKVFTSLRGGRMPAAAAYRYGYALYRAGDTNAAIGVLKPLASGKDTLSQYAAYYLGIAYLNAENLPFALSALDQARKLNFNAAVKEDAAFNHAKVQLDLGNGAEAIRELKEFQQAYAKSRYKADAEELLGDAFDVTNDYLGALKYYETQLQQNPSIRGKYQKTAFKQATSDYNGERYTSAIAYFDRSMQYSVDPGLKLAATFWKAEAHSAERKFDDAIPLYNQVLNSPDRSASVSDLQLKSRYALGYAYYNTREYDKANAQFRAYAQQAKSAPNKGNFEDAMLRLADTYFAAKNYDEALKTYNQVIAQGRTDKDYATYQKGVILEYLDRDAEAKTAFNQVLTQYPTSRYADDALYQLGMVDFNEANYQVAMRQFSRLIQEKAKSQLVPAAFLRRAIAYTNLKQYDEAISDYRVILSKYSNTKSAEPALLGLQDVLNTVGRPEEFATELEKYKQQNPGEGSLEKIEFETAKNLYFNEKYGQSVTALLAFMKSYPGSSLNFEAKYYLADSYFRTNDPSNALRYYYQVVADNKTAFVSRAAFRAAEIEASQKNYPRAIRNYQTLLSTASNNKDVVSAWSGLMDAFYQIQKYDSSLVYAREILNGGDVVFGAKNRAQLFIGKNLLGQGNGKRAIEELEKAANLAKDANGAEAKYLVAKTLYNEKNFKDAYTKIDELNNQFPDQGKWRDQGYLLLADVYVGQNDSFNAKATLNSIIENAEDKAVVEEARRKLSTLESN